MARSRNGAPSSFNGTALETVIDPISILSDTTPRLRIGIDLVQISAIADSIETFGDHFMHRIFSDDEVAYAKRAPALTAERLAARFAAKEAAMKVFGLSEAGVAWRDIEVCRAADGSCSLRLHREAARIAAASGCAQVALSLSHDGDYATAVIAALP